MSGLIKYFLASWCKNPTLNCAITGLHQMVCHLFSDTPLSKQVSISKMIHHRIMFNVFFPDFQMIYQMAGTFSMGRHCSLKQRGHRFTDIIFKCIFFKEHPCILIQISQKFVPNSLTDSKPSYIQVMTRLELNSSQTIPQTNVDNFILWFNMVGVSRPPCVKFHS